MHGRPRIQMGILLWQVIGSRNVHQVNGHWNIVSLDSCGWIQRTMANDWVKLFTRSATMLELFTRWGNVRVVQTGLRARIGKRRVSEKTNGTWLQLVRSCALSTVLWVPDFRSRSMRESSGFPRVARRGWVSDERGYWFLNYNIQTKELNLMCELIY